MKKPVWTDISVDTLGHLKRHSSCRDRERPVWLTSLLSFGYDSPPLARYSFTNQYLGGHLVGPSEAGAVAASSVTRKEWTVRDIPVAVRLAFDLEKLGTAALGLTGAALIYGLFNWLGLLTGDRAAHRVFAVLGAILATCMAVFFSGLVARMATVQLLEDRRIGSGELTQFARERWTTLVGIPFAFGSIGLLMLGFEAILALVGQIPGIGPIVWSSSFLLAFFMSLTAVLTAVVHMVGAFLYPTIVAIRGVGAVGAIIEVVELARRKPLYLILYEAIVAAVGALMTFLIGAVVWASLNLTMFLGGAIMHEKFDQTLSALPAFFRIFLRPFAKIIPLSPEEIELAWHYDLSGLLLGVSLLVVVILTVVYPFVFFTSAGSIVYLILRHQDRQEPVERSPIEDL